MVDRDVISEIWDAAVPIEFSFTANDGSDSKCYMLLKRIAYLPFAFDQIAETCNIELHPPGEETVQVNPLWVSYKTTPLKWHVPVGVLYDCLTFDENDDPRPWALTVHNKDYPEKKILFYNSSTDLEHHFLSRIKESTFIKRGEIDRKGLTDAQNLKKLWRGLKHDSFDDFYSLNSELSKPAEGHFFRDFPFCIYLCKKTTGEWGVAEFLRRKVSVVSTSGVPHTLNDLLHEMFGNRFEYTNAAAVTDVGEAAAKRVDGGDEAEGDGASEEKPSARAEVLMHGTMPPLCATLQWINQHLAHPDGFCHLIVRVLS